jgi:hypothetical protein
MLGPGIVTLSQIPNTVRREQTFSIVGWFMHRISHSSLVMSKSCSCRSSRVPDLSTVLTCPGCPCKARHPPHPSSFDRKLKRSLLRHFSDSIKLLTVCQIIIDYRQFHSRGYIICLRGEHGQALGLLPLVPKLGRATLSKVRVYFPGRASSETPLTSTGEVVRFSSKQEVSIFPVAVRESRVSTLN